MTPTKELTFAGNVLSPLEQQVVLLVHLAHEVGIAPSFSAPAHAALRDHARVMADVRLFLYPVRCDDEEYGDDDEPQWGFGLTNDGEHLALWLLDKLKPTRDEILSWLGRADPGPPGPKPPGELPRHQLVDLVESLQRLAFQDPRTDDWDRDKPLGSDFIGEVVDLLDRFGLAPPADDETRA